MSEEKIAANCIHQDKWGHCELCEKLLYRKPMTEKDLRCSNFPNCKYKQLQAKQKENEDLSKQLKQITASRDYFLSQVESFESTRLEHQHQVMVEIPDLQQKNKDLNEELKDTLNKIISGFKDSGLCSYDGDDKYEYDCRDCDISANCPYDIAKQALEKA